MRRTVCVSEGCFPLQSSPVHVEVMGNGKQRKAKKKKIDVNEKLQDNLRARKTRFSKIAGAIHKKKQQRKRSWDKKKKKHDFATFMQRTE